MTGSGKMRQGDRPEAAEAGERLPLLRRGGPLLLLDASSAVRMAARMSRALAFSPLAIAAAGGGVLTVGKCRAQLGGWHDVISSLRFRPRHRGLTARRGISPSRERSGRLQAENWGDLQGDPLPACNARRADYRAVAQGPGRGWSGGKGIVGRGGIEVEQLLAA